MLVCSSCQSERPPIHGDGPVPSTIMVIGEGPGWDEVFKTRRCFTGKSGRELNERILPLMGLQRYEVFTANARRCSQPRFVNPTPSQAMDCSNHWLHADLQRVKPYVILAFGGVSWSLFDQSLPISVCHGIPFVRSFGQWTGYVIPILHPAAGLRQSDMMIKILEDAKAIYQDRLLEQCITNTYVAPQDPYPVTDYREITTLAEQDEYWYLCQDHMGLDTESDTSEHERLHAAPPWCLTYSLAPGTGRLIMANRRDLLNDFQARLTRYRLLVSMHNALHDLNVCTQMGVTISRYVDTMLRANTIQTLPKGLKALAYRLLHMSMLDFDDVCIGPSNTQALYYLGEFLRQQRAKYEYEHHLKSGARKGQSELRWRKDRPAMIGKAVTQSNAAIKSFGQSPILLLDPAYANQQGEEVQEASPTTTIWNRWDNWNPDVRQAIVGALGGMAFPRKSITWVPKHAAHQYAIRDADASWRLHPELRRRIYGAGRHVPTGA